MCCKKFDIEINGNGTQSEILTDLKAIETKIQHSPVPLSRIEAKFIRQKLRQAKGSGGEMASNDLATSYLLPFDFCEKCAEITPIIRTYKSCQCAYCNTDRQQDITLSFSNNLKCNINERDA
jgi:hypothetical protein